MKALIKSLAAALSFRFPTEKELDERYLADATDIYDLEYRMKRLDARRAPPAYGPYALFMR